MEALRNILPAPDYGFLSSIAESAMVEGTPCIRLYNGDVLFGFSNWTKTYYAEHFAKHGDAFASLNVREFAYGAAFDALISYHYENSRPLIKSLYLRRGAVVLDVGIRAAHWLVKAARVAGGACRIIGVDATDFSEAYARRHIDVNGLNEKCTFVRAAVGAVSGEKRRFFFGSSGESFSGFHATTKNASGLDVVRADMHGNQAEVAVSTIDSIVESLGLRRLDMIVLQINGAEREALEGAAESLKRFQPIIYVTSYHTEAGGGEHLVLERDLEKFSYRAIARSDSCLILKAL